MNQVTQVGAIDANLAPDAFRRWANHYYECKQQFVPPHSFSPVPYFLLCRAIELGIKATHLSSLTQKQVRKRFGHDLVKAYDALEPVYQILSSAEAGVLRQAIDIYDPKGFEYFEPEDALTGFRRYPDLAQLDAIVKKLMA
jgi:hypothetical protein